MIPLPNNYDRCKIASPPDWDSGTDDMDYLEWQMREQEERKDHAYHVGVDLEIEEGRQK